MGNNKKSGQRGRHGSPRTLATGKAAARQASAPQTSAPASPPTPAADATELEKPQTGAFTHGSADRLPLSYPVEDDGWDATTFIRQTAEVLRDNQTAMPTDAALNEMDLENMTLPDEDMLDEQAFLSEDSDD